VSVRHAKWLESGSRWAKPHNDIQLPVNFEYVGLIVNDFLLVGAPRDQIITPQDLEEAGREPFATWPVSLSEEEQRVAWVELYIKGPDAHIMPDLEHPPFLLRRAIPWGIDYRGFTPFNVLVGERETDESGA
jgi:hypothetical protein